jgi:hypothetical protein
MEDLDGSGNAALHFGGAGHAVSLGSGPLVSADRLAVFRAGLLEPLVSLGCTAQPRSGPGSGLVSRDRRPRAVAQEGKPCARLPPEPHPHSRLDPRRTASSRPLTIAFFGGITEIPSFAVHRGDPLLIAIDRGSSCSRSNRVRSAVSMLTVRKMTGCAVNAARSSRRQV